MVRITLHTLFENIPVPLYLLSIMLHSIGIFLLLTLKHRRNQDIIIMNLSIAEISMSLCDFSQNILSRYHNVSAFHIKVLTITQCSLFVVPSFLIMIVLTVDRFLEVYLNIKYHTYVHKFKVKVSLSICWCAGMSIAILLLTLKFRSINSAAIIFKFIFPSVEGMFLLVALVCYIYIFNKFKEMKKTPTVPSIVRKKLECARIFPPFLIILTFGMFVVAPDTVNLYLFYISEKGTNFHANILLLFYVLGFISDAVIYIFLQKSMRLHFLKTFCGNAKNHTGGFNLIQNKKKGPLNRICAVHGERFDNGCVNIAYATYQQ